MHLRTRISAVARPVLLEDAHGPVAVYGVPYAEPDAVRAELPPETGKGHAGVLGHASARSGPTRTPAACAAGWSWPTGG